MVDALREAHRVLRPDGLLVDLRPAAVHRRVGVADADGYRLRWVMRENFDDDRTADRAVAHVLSEGLFKTAGRMRFPCYRVMDALAEFQEWLTDFVQKGEFPSHDWLVRRLAGELGKSPAKTRIVVRAPLILQALRQSK